MTIMFRRTLLTVATSCLLFGCNQPGPQPLNHASIPSRRAELQNTLARVPLAESWDLILPRTTLHRLYLEEDILFAETQSGWVYAIDSSSGRTLWTLELSDSDTVRHLDHRPGLSNTHVALISSGVLHIVKRKYGELTHKVVLPFAAMSPATPVGNRVYVGGHDNYLYAFNYVKGIRDWRFSTDGEIITKPLHKAPYIYFASGDKRIYQIQETTGKQIFALPTIGEVGADMTTEGPSVLATTLDNRVYNITNGILQWKFFSDQELRTPSIATKTAVFVIDRAPTLYCIDRGHGTEKWRASDIHQYLFRGTHHDFALQGKHWLVRLHSEDGTTDGRYDLSAFDFFLTNPNTNALYVGTHDGALFCLTEQ